MMRLSISRDANDDLDSIFAYIYRDRPRAALELMDRIADRMKLLRMSPESGEICEALGAGIRRVVVGNYAVYYKPDVEEINVLRILHSARDMPASFNDPPNS